MDWNQLRYQWQATGRAGATDDVLARVQTRDRRLRRQLRVRDGIETFVAVLIAPVFAWLSWRAFVREAWTPLLFSALLTAWVCYVPVHLWRARRQLPHPRRDLALLDYLRQERDAMLAQARMLGRIWVWYLAPCAIGVVGLVVSTAGVTVKTVVYALVVLGMCTLIGWANRHAARTAFAALAAEIERQIATLTEEERR